MNEQSPMFPDLPQPDVEPPAESDAPRAPLRLSTPMRDQVELRMVDLDRSIPPDHPARAVWAFVEGLDFTALYEQIQSMEGRPGRPAIDPKVLMALWLYATIDAVGSARRLARLCEDHDAYRWICGGVSVNHHTLSDFRVDHERWLDDQLTRSVAVLMHAELVTLTRIAQDGMRVRANAGASSFRRRDSMGKCLKKAGSQVRKLRRELEDDAGSESRQEKAARERADAEREQRVQAALEQLEEIERNRNRKTKARKPDESEEEHAKRTEPRASTTDPQARVMKMADGGFRPAYNVQFATDVASQVIVGVDVVNVGSDLSQLSPMLEQIEERYGSKPSEVLVDGGFANHAAITDADADGITVYAPVVKPRDRERDPYRPRPGDSDAIARWRVRMGTEAAQQIYRERAASVECANARCRQRGLCQFPVRGLVKARAVALWHALAHNLIRACSLSQEAAIPA